MVFGCGVEKPVGQQSIFLHPYYDTADRPADMQSVGLAGCRTKVFKSFAVNRFTFKPEFQRECNKVREGVGGMSCFHSSGQTGYYNISPGQKMGICADAGFNPPKLSAEETAFKAAEAIDRSAKKLQLLTGRKDSLIPRVNVEIYSTYRSVEVNREFERNGKYPARYLLGNLAYFYGSNSIVIEPPSANVYSMFSISSLFHLWDHWFSLNHEYGHAIEYKDTGDGICKDFEMRGAGLTKEQPGFQVVKKLCRGVREAVADMYGIFLSNEPVSSIEELPVYGVGRNPFNHVYHNGGYKNWRGQSQPTVFKTFGRDRLSVYLASEKLSRTHGDPIVRDSHFLGSVFVHHWVNALFLKSGYSSSTPTGDIAKWVVPVTADFTKELARRMGKTSLGLDPNSRARAYIKLVNDSFANAIERHASKFPNLNRPHNFAGSPVRSLIAKGFAGI